MPFAFFNEVSIIGELGGSLFERRLPEGFLVSHFAVLNHLARRGDGRTPLDLARAFQPPKTTMTHRLAGLAGAGLVRSAPILRDGRSKCVRLSDEGRAFPGDAVEWLGPDLRAIARTIAPDRVAAVLPLLAEMRGWLDRERDGRG